MSGSCLSPRFAAELASNVYLIKDDFSRRGFVLKYKDDFDMEASSMSKGKTGGCFINKPHVMAFLGIGKGRYKGQAFVAVKGTASLYDALTDLNTGIRSSHTGFPVHQGFYYAFDSILADLRRFVSSLKDVSAIHCVGHSVGGAIATLAADWVKVSSAISSTKLYTFGSPRVGLESFASRCTSNLVASSVFRVCHTTDPVPMVPTWPFFHVPNTDIGYLIFSPMAVKPWEYHLMKHYIRSAEAAGSWEGIASNRPAGHLDSAVERWLKSDGFISFTANTLDLLNAALIYVIKKVVKVVGVTLVTAAAGTLTLLDRMAIFMAKAAKVPSDVSTWVFHLVRKMAELIGIKVKEGTDLTVAFIRKVFLILHKRISDMIWRIGQEIS